MHRLAASARTDSGATQIRGPRRRRRSCGRRRGERIFSATRPPRPSTRLVVAASHSSGEVEIQVSRDRDAVTRQDVLLFGLGQPFAAVVKRAATIGAGLSASTATRGSRWGCLHQQIPGCGGSSTMFRNARTRLVGRVVGGMLRLGEMRARRFSTAARPTSTTGRRAAPQGTDVAAAASTSLGTIAVGA